MPKRLLRDWTDSYRVDLLSSAAETLLVRLLMKADDYGRYHADTRLVRSGCFPFRPTLREADIVLWIAECVKADVIVVYKVSGRSYLAIKNFGQRAQSGPKFPCPVGCAEPWLPLFSTVLNGETPFSTARASNTNTNTNTTPTSNSSPERGSGGKPDLPHSAIRDRLNALFKREPSFPWGNDEEHYLIDVAKRPNCLAEMAEIEAFWAAGNYRPQSVRSLLDGWPALLDRARNHRENMARNAKPKHQPESGQREEHIVLKRLFAS